MSPGRSMKVLLVDDEQIVHQTLAPYMKEMKHRVESCVDGCKALSLIKDNAYDLVLLDVRMPGVDGLGVLQKVREIRPELPVVIISGHANMDLAIDALRLGAADFLTKPVKLLELDAVLAKTARLGDLLVRQRRLYDTIAELQALDDQRERGRQMIAQSPAMQKVKEQIRAAVEANCDTILIAGETGTGKEVVAREIHFLGHSGDQKPFIAVSCPALPESLVESELFGHVKGAFTGAVGDKAGCFELADGGSLFLDEVADLSSGAQAKLLRVLETRSVRRVGGANEVPVAVRVITATNQPLEELVEEGKFRSDLYYRLNVFALQLDPLRDREEDIIPLAEHFLSSFVAKSGLAVTGISEPARQRLENYEYPGNARELRNIIERAAILCRSGLIGSEHLSLPEQSSPETPLENSENGDEKEVLLKALENAKWNRTRAAQDLGIPYSTLRYKLRKYQID